MSGLRLNLGSGSRPMPGYVNVDRTAMKGVDVVHNLDDFLWPWEDGSVDHIEMHQVLEHLADHNAAMREIHRILRPGGTANISVPHFSWEYAFHDPTHKSFWGMQSFHYYVNRGGYFDFAFSRVKVHLEFAKRRAFYNHAVEWIANRWPEMYEHTPLRMFPAMKVHGHFTK